MAKLTIAEDRKQAVISPEIYGHFSEHLGRCIYGGIYVGEDSEIPNTYGMRNDVVDALREMKLPVLRWPGGCFADEYHWMDGIGDKLARKKMINTNWGGVVEDNSFGTHEYMKLCSLIGCKTYINGNMGSGTVREMSEWVEYMTFDGVSPMADLRRENGHAKPFSIDYFGIGNESWGCGGNMNPEYYANEYRRYQTYVRVYDQSRPIKKIACGANTDDYTWTEEVLKTCYRGGGNLYHGFMDGLSLHYYTLPGDWMNKGSATCFTEEEYYITLKKAAYIETLIRSHGAIMDKYDKEKKIGMIIDEWGTWYDVEPGTNPGFLFQQNTMRDAMVAALSLNIFNKHADRVKMANIAQLVNVLQSVILTEGNEMVLTPTYYVFLMYKYHQGSTLLESYVTNETAGEGTQINALSESVSVDEDDTIHITICNMDAHKSYPLTIELSKSNIKGVTATILHNEIHAKNTFTEKEQVKEEEFLEYIINGNVIECEIPYCSLLSIHVVR